MSDPIATSPHVLIRADAGPEIGTGHVMRMIALAQACQDRGGSLTLASRTCPDGLIHRVRQEGILFERIEDRAPDTTGGRAATVGLARSLQCSWVVLDGYHFDVSFQQMLREAGFKTLVVDDYGHCEHWVADAVLNQNLHGTDLRYRSEVAGCRLLLGPRFALLRREFRNDMYRATRAGAGDNASIHRLLITLGGTDRDNVTERLLRALNRSAAPRLEIRVVLGAGNPHQGSLRECVAGSPHGIELLRNVLDMASLYRWADGVISAGGSTCWEWMFYRVPAAVICIADNQRRVVASLAKHRLALDLGWHEDLDPVETSDRLHDWLRRPGHFIATNPPPDSAVDGFGAERVAAVLDGSHAWLRPAQATDARLWFAWANDPAVRANGFHPDPISWDTHAAWFEHHRKSPDSRLWIGFDPEDQPLGYVRLHRKQAKEWEIGVAVAPERRGQGIGATLVRLALNRFAREPGKAASSVLARIKSSNAPSLSLFQSLGFRRDKSRTTAEGCLLTRNID